MDDDTFTAVVEDHLRTLTEDSRRPLWSEQLAPRTRDTLTRLARPEAPQPGQGGHGLAVRARAEQNLISAALTTP
jgi:hypothetical protein